jgi:hypothetical protein
MGERVRHLILHATIYSPVAVLVLFEKAIKVVGVSGVARRIDMVRASKSHRGG